MTFREIFVAFRRSAPRVKPADCAGRIKDGHALLVDVREPKEWQTGTAELATPLPLSDLCGAETKWQPFLKAVGSREVVLFCGAGVRSGFAARLLRSRGIQAVNGGAFSEWKAFGWPVVKPAPPNSGAAPASGPADSI